MKNFWSGKNGAFLIAEIGVNHEGSFERAKKILNLASLSEVDAIKFQIYQGPLLCNQKMLPENVKRMNKFQLTKRQHLYLADKCIERGFMYSSSIWDKSVIKWIHKKMSFFKIGSGDLTNVELIKEFCKYKKPIILSTGLSNFHEVKKSVKFIKEQSNFYKNKKNLVILQCTSSYPTKSEDINLNFLRNLNKLRYTLGYSHHNLSSYPLEIAYTLGAKVLEFHFTDKKFNRKFRDHKLSLTNNSVKKLVNRIKYINSIMSNKAQKKPTKTEIKNITNFRRGIYLKRDLKKFNNFFKRSCLFKAKKGYLCLKILFNY